MKYRKKLIEVTLPLEVINKASAREKSIRHGHPSTLHLWWSRKPLATCRAVLFASLIDDPSEHPDKFPTEDSQEQERQRLFQILEDLIQWENSNNEAVLSKVLAEIHTQENIPLPPVRDPFCGGGSIPLEAQRLGLDARASDLNPVAVLITKALIEIPSKFAEHTPINPNAQHMLLSDCWQGARGLAHDIRYYGKWMREEAERRIGFLYPKVVLPREYGEEETTVIAWLWVRTVVCPNPACGIHMPLTSEWWLSKKKDKEVWVEPSIDYSSTPPNIHFAIQTGKNKPDNGTVNRHGAICIACNTSVTFDYIRREGRAGHIDSQLIAIVAQGQHGRVYLNPTDEHFAAARHILPPDVLNTDLPEQALGFRVQIYGMTKHRDLFTPRQLVTLTTFSDLVLEARENVLKDAEKAGLSVDHMSLNEGGKGSVAYADAVATYLAIAVDRLADRNSTICSWDAGYVKVRNTFARQAIPMVWDFAEANPLSKSTGNFLGAVDWVAEAIEASPCKENGESSLGMILDGQGTSLTSLNTVYQRDATITVNGIKSAIISTDPPYYDNIGYADLSDFFYVWLRRTLNHIYPDLFKTVLTPKENELVANPHRFNGSRENAREFFEVHLSDIFEKMYKLQSPDYPLTLYYAFKQTGSEKGEEDNNGKYGEKGITFTGWETMLESLIQAGFTITGTWPIRTEMVNRSVGQGTNALASSIILCCRPRPVGEKIVSRRHFLTALRVELPKALKQLQHSGIAPVDLAQASIGPGMAIYSRYSKIVESNGTRLDVRTALQLINRALDEVLSEQEGEYDAETRWVIAWFEAYGYEEKEYGRAEILSKAKNITVQSLAEAGILSSKGGKVRLLKRDEVVGGRNRKIGQSLSMWEVTQRMIYALIHHGGELEAGEILQRFGTLGEVARELAYRLYLVCERKGWSSEGFAYNSLVTSWPEISRHVKIEHKIVIQEKLF